MVKAEIKGGGIEEAAVVWGKKRLQRELRKERLPKKGPVIRIVDFETLSGSLRLPKLASEDPRDASLRFDPISGKIYVPFWTEVVVRKDDNGRRHLDDPKKFGQLLSGREREVDLQNLPERAVSRLQMKCSPDIETAILQAYHVQERYLGVEAEQLETIWEQINGVWRRVLEGQVTVASLGELATQTTEVLEEAGLARARKNAKVNIERRLVGVFQKDSLERVNPLIQRVRLRSVYLEAIGLETFSVLVREKFAAVAGLLLMEREITRQSLADATGVLDSMMGFTKRGASVFAGEKPQKGEKEGLDLILKGVARLLSRPRVAPYLPVARAAGVTLWGCRPECIGINKNIIGGERAQFLLSPEFVCARRLIASGMFTEAKELTKEEVYTPITTLLDQASIGKDTLK